MGINTFKIVKDGNSGKILDSAMTAVCRLEVEEDHLYDFSPSSTEFNKPFKISKFEIFENNLGQGKARWTWERGGSSPVYCPLVAVCFHNEVGVLLVNINTTEDCPKTHYFKITVSDGNNHYPSDPELKIPKRGRPGIDCPDDTKCPK